MKRLFLILGVLFLLIAFFAFVFLPIDPTSSKEVMFSIEKGKGSRDIARALEQQGLIYSGPFFRLYVLTTGTSGTLQAGTYALSPALSLFQIAHILATGDVIKETITIIEGWDITDIASYFEKQGLFQAEEVLNYEYLEGYLFPDTYEIQPTTPLVEVFAMMQENFQKKFTKELQEQAKRQGRTTSEIVIMASLLERELQTYKDKQIAADVLWKRLDIGMALQVDAASQTYEQRGLPESPIANPGLKSITAAIYPKESPYWYYLSEKNGRTIFSKTLEEHNKAKAFYLK